MTTGQVLFNQGDPGDAAYVVLSGTADVLVDSPSGPIKVAYVEPNAIVGEIAILCDVSRTATVKTTAPVEALRIRKDHFLQLLAISRNDHRDHARPGRPPEPHHGRAHRSPQSASATGQIIFAKAVDEIAVLAGTRGQRQARGVGDGERQVGQDERAFGQRRREMRGDNARSSLDCVGGKGADIRMRQHDLAGEARAPAAAASAIDRPQ